jgi:prepilin-type processing-associated H-X9-DG protein
MTISYTCPHCGKNFDVDDKYAGQTGPCSGCGQTITIPPAADALPSQPAPAPSGSSGTGSTLVVVLVVCVVGFFACGGVLIALLLPAIQAAREAARRAQCANNMKQIALAFHNYHDCYNTFPPAYIPDEDGQPMHSWRTLILPFMEYSWVYDQYNFDEPWDSPSNMAVANIPIPAYTCPSSYESGPQSTTTNYMVITGPGTVFDGPHACHLANITDGASLTIMVVEVAGTGVNWAEPVDLDASSLRTPINAGGPGTTGSRHGRGIQAAMCDGSVRFLDENTDPVTLQAMITRAGGEPIPFLP